MTERLKMSLGGTWLLISGLALALPIFLPSTMGSPTLTGNVIGTATATMFVLSFPSSLFGIPLLYIVDYVLGLDPRSIQGMYLNLLMLFVLGLVQWFWIVPRLWGSESAIQMLNLRLPTNNAVLTEGHIDKEMFDLTDTTPLERVLRDKD